MMMWFVIIGLGKLFGEITVFGVVIMEYKRYKTSELLEFLDYLEHTVYTHKILYTECLRELARRSSVMALLYQ